MAGIVPNANDEVAFFAEAILSMCKVANDNVQEMETIIEEIENANEAFFDEYCNGESNQALKKKGEETVISLKDGLERLKNLLDEVTKISDKFHCADLALSANFKK